MVRYLPLARTRERPRLICPRPADDVSMSPPPPPARTIVLRGGCATFDACAFTNDGECDDGGPGWKYHRQLSHRPTADQLRRAAAPPPPCHASVGRAPSRRRPPRAAPPPPRPSARLPTTSRGLLAGVTSDGCRTTATAPRPTTTGSRWSSRRQSTRSIPTRSPSTPRSADASGFVTAVDVRAEAPSARHPPPIVGSATSLGGRPLRRARLGVDRGDQAQRHDAVRRVLALTAADALRQSGMRLGAHLIAAVRIHTRQRAAGRYPASDVCPAPSHPGARRAARRRRGSTLTPCGLTGSACGPGGTRSSRRPTRRWPRPRRRSVGLRRGRLPARTAAYQRGYRQGELRGPRAPLPSAIEELRPHNIDETLAPELVGRHVIDVCPKAAACATRARCRRRRPSRRPGCRPPAVAPHLGHRRHVRILAPRRRLCNDGRLRRGSPSPAGSAAGSCCAPGGWRRWQRRGRRR